MKLSDLITHLIQVDLDNGVGELEIVSGYVTLKKEDDTAATMIVNFSRIRKEEQEKARIIRRTQ